MLTLSQLGEGFFMLLPSINFGHMSIVV